MVKFLKITAAIVILLLLFYFVFFKYRQIQANKILIPATTQTLFKINVDELYKTLAVSYLKHPSQYAGTDKNSIREKIADLNSGLRIPANIYIYALKGTAKNTLFTRLEIADTSAFNHFILKKLALLKKDAHFFESADSTFGLLVNKKTVSIAFNMAKEPIRHILEEIHDQNNMVKISDSKFAQMASLSDHLSFQDAENLSKINFTDGKIDFSSEFENKWIEPAAEPRHRMLNPESTLSFWLNGKIKSDLTEKNHTMSLSLLSKDSFFRFYQDYVDFEWTKTVTQVDTIVGYEYNDDFEQVEKKILRDRKIPSITINLNSDDKAVSNYLKSLGALDQSTGKISSAMIPLYQFYFRGSNGNVQLSTIKSAKPDVKRASSDDFFYFKVDFKKLINQTSIPLIADKLGTFSQLEIKAKSIGKNKIKLESELLFLNKDANALMQVLKVFQNGFKSALDLNLSVDIPVSK
ncbi:hypothetical protein [Pedobacter terrae]|uniref:hypothetical protein n=1 Tax=Pedobacter terrae TaxID=405671 RepID=UPI002FF8EBEA